METANMKTIPQKDNLSALSKIVKTKSVLQTSLPVLTAFML